MRRNRFYVSGQETVTVNLTALSRVGVGQPDGFDFFMGPQGVHFQGPDSLQFTLGTGYYEYVAAVGFDPFSGGDDAIDLSASFANTVGFTNLVIADGVFQSQPIVSTDFHFVGAPSRGWFDPPTATEFTFEMTDASLFTEIMNFPTGFDAPFEVVAENTSLGLFTVNDSVNFTELLGHGVSSFAVKNITPGVDPESATAFPIQLAFNNATASFTMTPTPEPSTIILLGVSVVALGSFRRRQLA